MNSSCRNTERCCFKNLIQKQQEEQRSCKFSSSCCSLKWTFKATRLIHSLSDSLLSLHCAIFWGWHDMILHLSGSRGQAGPPQEAQQQNRHAPYMLWGSTRAARPHCPVCTNWTDPGLGEHPLPNAHCFQLHYSWAFDHHCDNELGLTWEREHWLLHLQGKSDLTSEWGHDHEDRLQVHLITFNQTLLCFFFAFLTSLNTNKLHLHTESFPVIYSKIIVLLLILADGSDEVT